ncbi:NAD(P)-binding protein [Westerdykella ornata]|uniref:NAD(P)-binding protein n=1 Tax=Westerdykella ornata TaxID=318751 RepID=A0A6A6JWQ5_WESOR|nr:NAD(P)-binding protein [Westerdykella ornata]KAF2281042.1 NAD(P)-binding protein [Westerdykella ornata]
MDPSEFSLPSESITAFTGPEHAHHDIYPSISASHTPSLRQPGKVVLITGAGRGCGRAMALQYAHAGVAGIILVSRTLPQLEEVESQIRSISPETKVSKHVVDVTNAQSVFDCAKAVEQDFGGRLDVLVNNAGTIYALAPLRDTKPEEWWHTYEVNIKGPYLFLKAFLPLLSGTAEKFKTLTHVVNISSIGALSINPGGTAYFTSKLALLRLTELVELEEGAKGVVSVAVHPGGVATELTLPFENLKQFMTDTPELSGGFVVWITAGEKKWLGGRYLSATWDADRLEERKQEIVEGDKLKVKLAV